MESWYISSKKLWDEKREKRDLFSLLLVTIRFSEKKKTTNINLLVLALKKGGRSEEKNTEKENRTSIQP